MKTIHINLISDQLLPNIILTFTDNLCHGCVLVFGDDSLHHKGEILTRIYNGREIPVLYRSEGTSSHRLTQLKKQANQLLEWLSLHHADKHWILNATCGTKPMALAFVNAFNHFNNVHPESAKEGIPQALILYTDSQNRELPILNDGVDHSWQWRSVMTLPEILEANGFEYSDYINHENDHDIHGRTALTHRISKSFNAPQGNSLQGALQHAATTAFKQFATCPTQSLPISVINNFTILGRHLVQAGMIEWDEQTQDITFLSEDACRYLSGRWLEELTYLIAKECGFKHVAMSVAGKWQTTALHSGSEQGKNNEFDVLICHNNQLLTIECKAKNFGNTTGYEASNPGTTEYETSNQDTVLKLESLSRKLGGLFGERLLVSSHKVPDAMEQRLKDNHIDLCQSAGTQEINASLRTFFNKMDSK